MRDIEKQIVYNQIQAGHRQIEELSDREIKELKVMWLTDKFKDMPPWEFVEKLNSEQRRREKQTASKPLRPIDREFYS